jgi:hypothetical protein
MKTSIYQICYSQETLSNIPSGFLPLNNLSNERPDWREYWAIRNFLLNNYLADDTLYGFFSPKFNQKTNLNYEKIQNFLSSNYTNEDVVGFSPFWDLISIFKNTFEQGDFFHPGLMEVCQLFADTHLTGLNLKDCITHSENTIFCNYFLAKKSFWVQWLEIGEKLFQLSENQQNAFSQKLNSSTSYGEQRVPMKVFVQERLVTICLLANTKLNCLNFNPFDIGSSTTPFNKFQREAVISDALKRAYIKTGHQTYLTEFSNLRNTIIEKLNVRLIET